MRFFVGLTSLFFASVVFFSFADEQAPLAPCERASQAESAQKLCKSDANENTRSSDSETKPAPTAVDYAQLKRLLLAQKISSTSEVELPDDI
jgi:hypothetical protein